MNKLEILKENLIYFKDADITDLEMLSFDKNKFFFDTESCPSLPTEIVDKYNLREVELSIIPEFQTTKEGSILHTLHRNKQLHATVYLWMFGCNTSNKVYYGNTITEFISFIQKIDEYKINEHGQVQPYDIYVHNLAWDIEFFKYWFKEKKFQQIRVSQEKKQTAKNKKLENHFDITETDGTVHNATIQLNKIAFKKGRKKVSYMTILNFFDSFKITPMSLKAISEGMLSYNTPEEKEMYTKDSSDYQYDLVRTPEGYKPTEIESWYIYCDIYLLKEWYNQIVQDFYIDTLGLKHVYTISQIAFESVLKKTYDDNKLRTELTPPGAKPLTDREIYEQHYALKIIEKNPMHYEYFRLAYKGGHTTASTKYTQLASKNTNTLSGVSMDITSSYPSQMTNKPLPFGMPSPIKEGKYQDFKSGKRNYNYHYITIGFDGWYSKDPDNQFGLNLKIYGLNDHQKKELNYTPNESYSHNIVDGCFVGTNRITVNSPKRAKIISNLNYNFIVTLTHHEYELWIKQFNFVRYEKGKRVEGVHFIDYVSFQSEIGHFAKGLDYFFKLKEEGDREGNKAKTLNAKLIINSFYGKHCSRRDREQRFYDFDKDIISFKPVTDDNINEWQDEKLFAVHYGASVTSWGRCQLRETAINIGQDLFVYADTDSLKFQIDPEEFKQRCVDNDIKISYCPEDKHLGWWDFEFEFEDFKAIGQKKYMYKKKGQADFVCKCAGLPADIRKKITSKDKFYIGSIFNKVAKKKVIGGNLMLYTEYSISDLTRL